MRHTLVLMVSVLVFVSLLLSACGAATPVITQPITTAQPTATEAITGIIKEATRSQPANPVSNGRFGEAPDLAELVEAGRLPPVEDRLPANPLVVEAPQVGAYGGDWRMAMPGPNMDGGTAVKAFDYENLVRWDPTWSQYLPNLAESWEVNQDATEFIFHLRQGVKWSDGQPWGADDILFWREVVADATITPFITPTYLRGGRLPEVTKIDDTTVKFTFVEPYGLFLQVLATTDAEAITKMPAHYARQFLPAYNDQAKLDEMMKKEGFATLRDLFINRVGEAVYGGGNGQYSARRPTLAPWMVETPFEPGGSQVTFTRNPYYWKIDQEGNQYPYIDRVVVSVIPEISAMVYKAANGEIDYQSRHFATIANKAILVDNRARGQYYFQKLVEAGNNRAVINLNLTHKDPALRAIFQNKDFRIGLSHAIDRQSIINTIYIGQGTPQQAAPIESSIFYVEQLARQYTGFDIAMANEYLDKVLPGRDANGWRLRPDGRPFTFVLLCADSPVVEMSDIAAMVVKMWRAVGINVQMEEATREVFYQTKENNDHDALLSGSEGGINAISDPRSYLPWSTESDFAPAWVYWYLKARPELAEEPPAEIKALMDQWDQIAATADYELQIHLMRDLLQMSAEQFLNIGITTPTTSYAIVSNRLRNVPAQLINTFQCPNPAVGNPFTWFYSP